MTDWLRTRATEPHQGNGTYVNLRSGTRLGVNEYQNRDGSALHRVWLKVTGQPAETLGDGFETREDAVSALDALMSEYEFRQLDTPPVKPEEITDATEEEVK